MKKIIITAVLASLVFMPAIVSALNIDANQIMQAGQQVMKRAAERGIIGTAPQLQLFTEAYQRAQAANPVPADLAFKASVDSMQRAIELVTTGLEIPNPQVDQTKFDEFVDGLIQEHGPELRAAAATLIERMGILQDLESAEITKLKRDATTIRDLISDGV